MVPCRCDVLSTLRGVAAGDYARQHLDVVRESSGDRTDLHCPESDVVWVLEPVGGALGTDRQLQLRRGTT